MFSKIELQNAIDGLKNNKPPGVDNIPVEFIKCFKDFLSDIITEVINHSIEKRDFPQYWAEGIRSMVYKGGTCNMPENYKGDDPTDTRKEIAVYRRD